MSFDYEIKFNELLKKKDQKKFYIRPSTATFKIELYQKKAEKSFMLAAFLINAIEKNKIKEYELPEELFLNYWIITISYYSMLYIAKALILTKGYETDDHKSTEIAVGKLFVAIDELKKEDLELLNQSYKILEEEYITYFIDARKESRTARYTAIKSYEKQRVKEIYANAKKFIAKLSLMI